MRIAKWNLKKQSQFIKVENIVKSISTMVYGDFGGPRQRKNKANLIFFGGFLQSMAGEKRKIVLGTYRLIG